MLFVLLDKAVFGGVQSVNIRQKTTAASLLSIGALILVLYFLFSAILLDQFEELEKQTILKDMERARRAVQAEQSVLASKVGDWAKWDDSYEFMVDGNEKYKTANLSFSSLTTLNIDYALFFDAVGNYFYGVHVDKAEERTAPVPDAILRSFSVDKPYVHHADEKSRKVGIVKCESSYLLFASLPILKSDERGPIRGTLIIGKALSGELIRTLAVQTQLTLRLFPVDKLKRHDQLASVEHKLLAPGEPAVTKTRGEERISALRVLRDPLGSPLLVLQVEKPREIYMQGLRARRYILISLCVAGVISCLLILYLFEKTLLSRLTRLAQEVVELSASGDLRRRVGQGGADELSALTSTLNNMLAGLEQSRAQILSAKAAAEAANEAKTRFVANISHELRTPLHGIIGMVKVMQATEEMPAKREYMATVLNCADSLLNMINEVLDFSKINAGKLALEEAEFDLRGTVAEALRQAAPRAEEKSLLVAGDVRPGTGRKFVGDALRLRQILLNLLGNSVKFTDHGDIQVTVEELASGRDEVTLQFTVRDTGVGIPREKQAAVFEAFSQVDSSAAKRYSGTGLGLTITRQLVELMGGTISLKSKEGEGTEIIFTVKLKRSDQEGQEKPSSLAGNVLVVEDDNFFSTALMREFESRGLSAARAVSLNDAERMFAENSACFFDFVLIDSSTPLSAAADFLQRRRQTLPHTIGRSVFFFKTTELPLLQTDEAKWFSKTIMKPILPCQVLDLLEEDQSGAGSDEVTEPRRERRRIAAADDSKTNRTLLKLMLEQQGHEVVLYEDGKEVVAEFGRVKGAVRSFTDAFDMLIIDMQMPVVDGYAATKALREMEAELAHKAGQHIARFPIIAATAFTSQEDRMEMVIAGVDAVVLKPIRPEDLEKLFAKFFLHKEEEERRYRKGSGSTDSLKAIEESLLQHAQAAAEAVINVQMRAEKEEVFDLSSLFEQFAGDYDAIPELLEIFLEEQKELRQSLISAMEQGESLPIKRAAHALKGALANAGAKAASEAAANLEKAANAERTEDFAQLNQVLLSALDDAVLVIVEFQDRAFGRVPADAQNFEAP